MYVCKYNKVLAISSSYSSINLNVSIYSFRLLSKGNILKTIILIILINGYKISFQDQVIQNFISILTRLHPIQCTDLFSYRPWNVLRHHFCIHCDDLRSSFTHFALFPHSLRSSFIFYFHSHFALSAHFMYKFLSK